MLHSAPHFWPLTDVPVRLSDGWQEWVWFAVLLFLCLVLLFCAVVLEACI